MDRGSLLKVYSAIDELCRTRKSIIYKARHRLTGVTYCIKRSVHGSSLKDCCEESLSNALNECQALSVLRHRNVVRFYNSWFEAGAVLMQLEYCVGGSLSDCLRTTRDSGVLSGTAIGKLLSDVAGALNYMHTKWCMAHRNVGLGTILVQLKPQVASHLAFKSDEEAEEARTCCHQSLMSGESDVVDFKLASFGKASRISEAGDDRGVDVYALAVTVCLAAGGSAVSHGGNVLNVMNLSNIPLSLHSVLQSMLEPSGADRVSAGEVVEHLAIHHNDVTAELLLTQVISYWPVFVGYGLPLGALDAPSSVSIWSELLSAFLYPILVVGAFQAARHKALDPRQHRVSLRLHLLAALSMKPALCISSQLSIHAILSRYWQDRL
ncbi:unnamed protein product, partial [Hydatigera taeniaeformis]|uniref:Protein kinase domain-containing protein n=1 Tax=Hydatigena taeniaeformis TaxID=6205 RepID=A0A0R3WRX9_HYDTA